MREKRERRESEREEREGEEREGDKIEIDNIISLNRLARVDFTLSRKIIFLEWNLLLKATVIRLIFFHKKHVNTFC